MLVSAWSGTNGATAAAARRLPVGVLTLGRDRRVAAAIAGSVLAWLPVLLDRGAIASAAALWPLAESGNPYFVAEHWTLLYLWAPVVAVSAAILLLSPGLFLSLACGAATSPGAWVVSALALSLVAVSGGAAFAQAALGTPLRDAAFVVVVVTVAVLAMAAWLWRLHRRPSIAWPFDREGSVSMGLLMVGVPWLMLIALAPKFYWESFNGDGAHAYESSRLLLAQALPFWPAGAGDVAQFPGMTSMLFAYPSSWFIRLFGELEASARLPYILYVVALYGVIVELAEHGQAGALATVDRWLMWLPLAVYTLAMGFSATYDPYSADLALPATQDTLTVVCFLAFVLAVVQRRWIWAGFFAALTHLSLPSGILLMGFWLLAVTCVWTPRQGRDLVRVGAIIVGCAALAALAPYGLNALGLPAPGREYGGGELLGRFAFLQWADWRRLAFVAVPTGIVPVCALVAWRRQDRVGRSLTIVTVVYFALFFVQARATFHHYVPAMLLPLAVFWRMTRSSAPRQRGWLRAGLALAGSTSLFLSLPAHAGPHVTARVVGMSIDDRAGGYERVAPEALRRSVLLHELFPYDLEPSVPARSYGGSPLAWNYYAKRPGSASRDTNYVLQSASDPAPEGMRPVARDDTAALYVRSDEIWAGHRAIRPATPAGAPIYAVPRELVFGPLPVPGGLPVLDVRAMLERWGIDVEKLLAGVKR